VKALHPPICWRTIKAMSDQHGHGQSHGHGHGHSGHEHGDHGHGGHGHGHGHASRSARRWAWLTHWIAPHSHDAADRVDDALRTSRLGLRTVAWSFGLLAVTAAAQLAVVVATGSVALLGDTIHNAADALTAIPLAVAFRLGTRPASRSYTYGLGRAEDVAGVVVLLVVAGSALLAAYEAIERLLHPQPITHLWAVVAAGAIGFAGNEAVARMRIRVGRRIGSAALVADGVHARTDGFTSLAVIAGAGGVALGLPLADPIIGLLISVMILMTARGAARDVWRRLLDGVDPAAVALTERIAGDVPGIHSVHQPKLRWIGHALHAELTVTVAPTLTITAAHLLAHRVEHALLHAVPRLVSAVVHVEPAVGAAAAHEELAHHVPERR
jgi:cation diffusion facilitator family transporter